MQSLETKSLRPRPKSFETETRPETFETETSKNWVSRRVSRPRPCLKTPRNHVATWAQANDSGRNLDLNKIRFSHLHYILQ